MRRLSKRQRVDTLRTETRPRRRGRLGRYVYLALILALFLALFDFLSGGLLYLRAEGMLSRDVSVVAPEYVGTVLALEVEQGDRVERGQVLARLRSQRIVNDIARLAADLADAELRLSEMRIRRRKLTSLLPAAKARADETEADRARLKSLQDSGLVTVNRRTRAINDAYDALSDYSELRAESDLLASELPQMEETVAKARNALRELQDLYNEGRLTAPASGVVSGTLVAEGSGLREGEPVTEIFRGEPYVLAYVPVGTLYEVKPGEEVALRYGFKVMRGRISQLLPMTSRLPQEFQRAFQAVERKQLVRIDLEAPPAVLPPLFTKLSVTRLWALPAMGARFIAALDDKLEELPGLWATWSDELGL